MFVFKTLDYFVSRAERLLSLANSFPFLAFANFFYVPTKTQSAFPFMRPSDEPAVDFLTLYNIWREYQACALGWNKTVMSTQVFGNGISPIGGGGGGELRFFFAF